MKTTTPIEIAKRLPGINCGECGCTVCIGFSSTLYYGKISLDACTHLSDSDKRYIEEIIQPPVKEIVIGKGERSVIIGGEKVLYRHQLRFFNQTAIGFRIEDTIDLQDLQAKITKINQMVFKRSDNTLRPDLIMVKCSSNSAETFSNTVSYLIGHSNLPLFLNCSDAEILLAGLEQAKNHRPLIGMANKLNWMDFAKIAKNYQVPLAVEADFTELEGLMNKIEEAGCNELVLGVNSDNYARGFKESSLLRETAIQEGRYRYPTMSCLKNGISGPQEIAWASAQMLSHTSLLALDTDEPHFIFPLLVLRQNIFSDPCVAESVDSGLYTFGVPDENSPVFITGNFSMTFAAVSADIKAANLNCYLLVADTGGSAVGISVLLRKINGSAVARLIKENGLKEKIGHRSLVIPGLMESMKEEIASETEMEVFVGPLESTKIPVFMQNDWSM